MSSITKMLFKSKLRWATLGILCLSLVSLAAHLILAAISTTDLVPSGVGHFFRDELDLSSEVVRYKKRPWKNVKSLLLLRPFLDQQTSSAAYQAALEPAKNRYIYAEIHGGFEKIQASIPDLVAVARLLNASLVIPEIIASSRSRGISSQFSSFSYLYDADRFVEGLKHHVPIVNRLPNELDRTKLPVIKPTRSASPKYYLDEVLPLLEQSTAVALVVREGGCLENDLPHSMAAVQRLRCRVAFTALQFRPAILAVAHRMVEKLRTANQPYLAYHPGLLRDTLAYNGCAELFEDIHTELIQYRRAEMIKQNIINKKEPLNIESPIRKLNGSCPLMPSEVGILLQALGYTQETTRIYVAGSELFGGQRILLPLRAMYNNLLDRTCLSTQEELANLFGTDLPLQEDPVKPPPFKSADQLMEEWNKAHTRPWPIPPPPDRPFRHKEKEGWYGWVTEKEQEPEPSQMELKRQAYRLLFDALDYVVSVQADAFFPGFHNDGSGWPDFSSLVMGHRAYMTASSVTYRPDRKWIAKLFSKISDHTYSPSRRWRKVAKKHLTKSLGEEGITRELEFSKPSLFLAHPVPQCSCKLESSDRDTLGRVYGFIHECPEWMAHRETPELADVDNEDENEDNEDGGGEGNDNLDIILGDDAEEDDFGMEQRKSE